MRNSGASAGDRPDQDRRRGGWAGRATLLTVIGLLLVGTLGFRSANREKDVQIKSLLDGVEAAVKPGLWEQADSNAAKLQQTWLRVKGWLSLTNGSDEINDFDHNLARMRAAIEQKDKSSAAQELAELRYIWIELHE